MEESRFGLNSFSSLLVLTRETMGTKQGAAVLKKEKK